jgi:osmotically-inducible protein OsmY
MCCGSGQILVVGVAFALILTSALSGCATYRKCGIDGCPGDAKITANVQAQLNQHPELGGPNSINVETLNHVVYLNGLVSAGIESRTAESVALEVPGVSRVVNSVAVAH